MPKENPRISHIMGGKVRPHILFGCSRPDSGETGENAQLTRGTKLDEHYDRYTGLVQLKIVLLQVGKEPRIYLTGEADRSMTHQGLAHGQPCIFAGECYVKEKETGDKQYEIVSISTKSGTFQPSPAHAAASYAEVVHKLIEQSGDRIALKGESVLDFYRYSDPEQLEKVQEAFIALGAEKIDTHQVKIRAQLVADLREHFFNAIRGELKRVSPSITVPPEICKEKPKGRRVLGDISYTLGSPSHEEGQGDFRIKRPKFVKPPDGVGVSDNTGPRPFEQANKQAKPGTALFSEPTSPGSSCVTPDKGCLTPA